MKALREELELRRKTEIHEIEEVGSLMINKDYLFSLWHFCKDYSCTMQKLASTADV